MSEDAKDGCAVEIGSNLGCALMVIAVCAMFAALAFADGCRRQIAAPAAEGAK